MVTGGGVIGGTVTVPGGTVGGTTVAPVPGGVTTTVVSVGDVVVVVVVVVDSRALSPLQPTAHVTALMAAKARMAWERAFRFVMSAPALDVDRPRPGPRNYPRALVKTIC
jgi:hypothetical protein